MVEELLFVTSLSHLIVVLSPSDTCRVYVRPTAFGPSLTLFPAKRGGHYPSPLLFGPWFGLVRARGPPRLGSLLVLSSRDPTSLNESLLYGTPPISGWPKFCAGCRTGSNGRACIHRRSPQPDDSESLQTPHRKGGLRAWRCRPSLPWACRMPHAQYESHRFFHPKSSFFLHYCSL